MTDYISVFFGVPQISGDTHHELTHGPLQAGASSFQLAIEGKVLQAMWKEAAVPIVFYSLCAERVI